LAALLAATHFILAGVEAICDLFPAHMATAKASATSAGFGTSVSFKIEVTICATWAFDALP
jgi:hypothetical protein